jgi:hypothetical protein
VFCAKPIELLSLKIDGGGRLGWVSAENLIGYENLFIVSRRCAVIY